MRILLISFLLFLMGCLEPIRQRPLLDTCFWIKTFNCPPGMTLIVDDWINSEHYVYCCINK